MRAVSPLFLNGVRRSLTHAPPRRGQGAAPRTAPTRATGHGAVSASGAVYGVEDMRPRAFTRVPNGSRHIRVRSGCVCPNRVFVRNKGGVFSEPAFFLETFQARPTRAHTCPGITWRLCGGLGASVARDLRALRLWQSSRQWCAVPWSCIDAAPGCRALRRSSNNILTAWPGRVAQALRAGRSRTPWSSSPCWRLCREAPGWRTSYSSATK